MRLFVLAIHDIIYSEMKMMSFLSCIKEDIIYYTLKELNLKTAYFLDFQTTIYHAL